jgi:pimeloyl-ACP methyl ester carboxylesterase
VYIAARAPDAGEDYPALAKKLPTPPASAKTTVAAWRSKPSWYAVSKQDRTINPDLERFMAKRMKATTIEIDAGHLSVVSHPQDVSNLILAAAGQTS